MDIARAGVYMLVYLFVVVALYIFLSSPFDDMVSGFEDLNMTASDAKVDYTGGVIRTVFDLIFAGLAIVPLLWFIVWVFRREPDWRYR